MLKGILLQKGIVQKQTSRWDQSCKRVTGGNTCEGKGGGSQRRLGELSDPDAGLTPVKESGKEGRLDCSATLRKFTMVARKSLRQIRHPGSPFSPRNGSDLVFLPHLVRFEAAHVKCGFCTNAVVDSECSSLDHPLLCPLQEGFSEALLHSCLRHPYLMTLRIQHLTL